MLAFATFYSRGSLGATIRSLVVPSRSPNVRDSWLSAGHFDLVIQTYQRTRRRPRHQVPLAVNGDDASFWKAIRIDSMPDSNASLH